MLLVLVVMFVLAGAYIENFATGRNMAGLLLSVTTIAFIACTMMLCLASGDFDLSVGAVVAVAGMMCVVTINHTQHLGSFLSIGAGIVVGLAAGAAVGLVNGLLIAKANINALIATLGTMQIVRGIAFLVSDGKAVGVSNDDFAKLGTSSWPWHGFNSYYLTWAFEWQRGFPWLSGSFWWEYGEFRGISTPVLIMAAFFVVFGILLNRTTFGRNSLAIGGNKRSGASGRHRRRSHQDHHLHPARPGGGLCRHHSDFAPGQRPTQQRHGPGTSGYFPPACSAACRSLAAWPP